MATMQQGISGRDARHAAAAYSPRRFEISVA
jgi:hypothetical protein